jgi:2-hydroxychromene-2-carboxylate isomerase
LLALRVGLIAAQEGWCADYWRATFHDWFIERRAPGIGGHIERILSSLGKSADIIAGAEGAEGARLMQEATDDARKLGIFGAPTFAVGTEIFWGADRLEDAFAAGRFTCHQ